MVSDWFLLWFQMDLNDVLDSSSIVVFVEVQLGNRSSLELRGYLDAGRGEGERGRNAQGGDCWGRRGEVGFLEHRGLEGGPMQNWKLGLCIGDMNIEC